MSTDPKTITLPQIADVLASHFQHQKEITCYVGSNAATPTASIEALTAAVRAGAPKCCLPRFFDTDLLFCFDR
jgi:hypothetical protein